MLELLFGCVTVGAVGWVILTVFQPFYTSMKAGWDADREYAFDRWKRLQDLEAINARFKPIKEKESKENEPISRVRDNGRTAREGKVDKTSKTSNKQCKHKPKRRTSGSSKDKSR